MDYQFELLTKRVAELENGARFQIDQCLKVTKICIEQEKTIGEILVEVRFLRRKISELEARLVGMIRACDFAALAADFKPERLEPMISNSQEMPHSKFPQS